MVRNPIIGIFTFLLLLIAINLVFLDIIIFSEGRQTKVTTTDKPELVTASSCDTQCLAAIDAAVGRGLKRIATPTPQSAAPTTNVNTAKEFYIPLGAGSTRSSEYVELAGAEAYIDTTNYKNIKEIIFEVFLRNTTGNGQTFAKLRNATDGRDAAGSEVSMEGSPVTRREAKVTLDPGKKLYRVMLKSTMAYDVYVENARVKIVTQ